MRGGQGPADAGGGWASGRVLSRLLAVLFGVLLGFVACEIAASRVGRQDADGNRFVRSERLEPYHLPLRRVRELLRDYERAADSVHVVYSAELGWDVRPNDVIRDGSRTNSAGIRNGRDVVEYAPTPPPGTVRIALFGDSFTHGAVPYWETWGRYVESSLRANGIPAEVLNFGVGGYGLDQAYLRWRRIGRRFAPHVVILGFQPENVKRDLNLIRLVYVPDSGLPFSKPRFILDEGHLRLLNTPAVPPDSLPGVLERFDEWPLRRHERFYSPEDYREHVWLRSKVLAYCAAVLGGVGGRREAAERAFYDPAGEGGALTLAIVREFEAEAESTGAAFLLVHLPNLADVKCLLAKEGRLPYADLLSELKRRHTVVETADTLRRTALEGGLQALFGHGAHYVALGNRRVADALVAYFLTRWSDGRGVRPAAHGPVREAPPRTP